MSELSQNCGVEQVCHPPDTNAAAAIQFTSTFLKGPVSLRNAIADLRANVASRGLHSAEMSIRGHEWNSSTFRMFSQEGDGSGCLVMGKEGLFYLTRPGAANCSNSGCLSGPVRQP